MSGQAPSDAQLLVRAKAGDRIVEGQFTDLGLEDGGTSTVKIKQAGSQITMTLTDPDGDTDQAELKTTYTKPLPRPQILLAARAGSRVHVLYRTRTPGTAKIDLVASRQGGPATASRTEAVRRGLHHAQFTLAAGQKPKYVRITFSDASHQPAFAVKKIR